MVRETSSDCYNQIKEEGLLSKRRWEVYDILFKHGPMTSNETFDYSKLNGVDGYRHNANARMTELRDCGVVKEIGTRQCSKTGRNVILWDVTARLPTKRKRSSSSTKKHRIKTSIDALRELYKKKSKPQVEDWKNVAELIKGI